MSGTRSLLIDVLLDPPQAVRLDPKSWDLLIRQARSAQLLPRLAVLIEESGNIDAVPEAPRRHLDASREVQARQRQAVRWEVEKLLEALSPRGIRLVLLKGAAYEIAELPPARCRLFNDIDILVPRAELSNTEIALLMHGWLSAHLDAYDVRYYKQWMHELPPMQHRQRQSVIDVHHNLVPDTAPIHPDPVKLLDAAVPCNNRPEVFVLAPADLILHSAVHLFNDGEFDHALRDLLDIDELIRHFLNSDTDWQGLVDRARELDLVRPLFYALRYLRRSLNAAVPEQILRALDSAGPPVWTRSVLDSVFERGLQPDHLSCHSGLSRMARWMLYVRGHFLRMPIHLLTIHLTRKAIRQFSSQEKAQ